MRLILSLMLVGVFLFLYLLPLGVRPLVIPDEARYAEISREMLISGDWIVPRLNGLKYFEKPPLGYWLNATAIQLLGENEFAVRFPSAVAVGLTAVLLFVWAHKFSDDRATPLLATTVFLLSFEVLAVGTFCVLDSMLSLWVTAAIIALFFACRAQEARKRMPLLILAGVACGLAFLNKGFLGLALPVMVIVPFMIWQGQFKRCLRMAWVPLVAALLTALPWSILIYRREPDFWHYFFWVEHIDRFLSPRGRQHPEPLWYYVPILLAGAMPWTPLLGPIVQGLRQTSRKDPMVRLAVCWLVFPFLFFSVCSGKLGTYVLPCYPPLAFLIAAGVLTCLRGGDVKGFVTGARVVVAVAGSLPCRNARGFDHRAGTVQIDGPLEMGCRCGRSFALDNALPGGHRPDGYPQADSALLCRTHALHVQLAFCLSCGGEGQKDARSVSPIQRHDNPCGLHPCRRQCTCRFRVLVL